jgi:curved DNA-binding protein CbpA
VLNTDLTFYRGRAGSNLVTGDARGYSLPCGHGGWFDQPFFRKCETEPVAAIDLFGSRFHLVKRLFDGRIAAVDNQVKPHADTALDPQSLEEPPTSDQYYLYSRIDGAQTVDELCRTSGLGRQATLDALKQLHHLGLIVVPGYDGDDAGASTTRETMSESTSGTADPTADAAADVSSDNNEGRSLNESTAPLDETPGASESASTASGTATPDRTDPEAREDDSNEASARAVPVSEASGDEHGSVEDPVEASGGEDAEDEAADDSTDQQHKSGSTTTAGGVDFSGLPVSPDDIDIEAELLEMDVDLDEAFRRELVALSRQVDDVNYYEFYGIEPDADVGEIKKSYFHLSKRYHPDKHFGGELGPFKEMLEEVFQHITRAYRILTDEQRRESYDADLGGDGSAGAAGAETSTPTASPDASSEAGDDQEGPSRASEKDKQQKQEAASRLLVNRARKYREQGAIDDAADEYRKAVSLNRRLETALEAAQMLVEQQQRLEDAAVFARAALKLDESSVEGYYLLGRSYEGRDRMDEATNAYRRAVGQGGYEDASERLERLESQGETS